MRGKIMGKTGRFGALAILAALLVGSVPAVAVADEALTVEMAIDTVTRDRSGFAQVSGTITCSHELSETYLSVTLRQRAGRRYNIGWGSQYGLECSPTAERFSLAVFAEGPFRRGDAVAVGDFNGCYYDPDTFEYECDSHQTVKVVRL